MNVQKWLTVAIVALLTIGFTWHAATAQQAARTQLLSNGGFEEDQNNLRSERMSCPVQPRVTYGQTDGLPDDWTFDLAQPSRSRDKHSGTYSGLLRAAKDFKLEQSCDYAAQLKSRMTLPPLHFSMWAKGTKGDGAVAVRLVVTAVGKAGAMEAAKPIELFKLERNYAAAGAQWTQITFDVTPEQILSAAPAGSQPLGALRASLTLATAPDSADVLVDDIELGAATQTGPYTLVPNGGFESSAGSQPSDWSPPKKSLRFVGSTYYVWRSWYHYFGLPRGASQLDASVVRHGKNAFRMNVPPGDDKYVETAAIPLNQAAPQRMVLEFAYNSHLLANMLVQVMDQDGNEVFVQNVVPGSSRGWRTYRAEFLPRKSTFKGGDVRTGADLIGAGGDALALKSCRVRIGVKGVNGTEMDDINQWVNVNHGGALWIDDVVLAETESTDQELAARGAKPFPLNDPAPAVAVETVDLGQRLFGQNEALITLANHGASAASGTIKLTLSGPYRENDPKKGGFVTGTAGQAQDEPELPKLAEQTATAPYQIAAGSQAVLKLPYKIAELLPDWRCEYRVHLVLDDRAPVEIPLGTWTQPALVEIEKCYPFPEDNPLKVSMNVGVAQQSLDAIKTLRLEIRQARDDKQVWTRSISDFPQSAAAFNLAPLPEGFEGDNTNFLLTNIDIASLPVHAQAEPVRDHYLYVAGLDGSGSEVFHARSARFGRMEQHSERLEPIREVKIAQGNYLTINGKPFFTRGHLWMQQNFGPFPLARKNTDWKPYGFNVRAGVQNPLVEANAADPKYAAGVNELWDMHNTYVGSQMIAPTGPMSPAIQADIQKWLAKPNVIGIHFVPWEASPAGATPEQFLQYAKDVKAIIGGRPLWASSGWFAPRVNGRIEPVLAEHDWYAPENNAYFQPSQLDKEVLANKAGKPCVLSTYPNVFNDTPWIVQRFEHWTEIIRSHTGYMQIGKPGDPSLMAGMNGEFRFIETFLFSPDDAPKVKVAPKVEHLVRTNKKAHYIMASNVGPTIGGDWQWNTELKDQGRPSHTGTAFWSRLHDYMRDYHSHFYKDDRTVRTKSGDTIVQYVYLPPDEKIENLILMVRTNGEWRNHATWGNFNHQQFTDSGVRMWMAKDMHQMAWGSIDIGFCDPKGHDIKHPQLLKYTFTAEQFKSAGPLPSPSTWMRLEVPVDQLGIAGKLIDGFGFVSKGGKVWWGRTLIARQGKEKALCNGSAGIPPRDLAKVRFNVEGLKAGTKIKVCFEERDIVAAEGYFEDDLRGEPGYRNLWNGLYGDKIGETGYYGDGVMYDYNWGKVAARLYEIPK